MIILRLVEELINYLKKLRFREIFHFIEFSSGWQVGKLGNSPKLFCIFRQSLATCIWAEVVVFSNTKPSCRTQLEASVQLKGCSNSSPASLSRFYLTLGATDFCALYAFERLRVWPNYPMMVVLGLINSEIEPLNGREVADATDSWAAVQAATHTTHPEKSFRWASYRHLLILLLFLTYLAPRRLL